MGKKLSLTNKEYIFLRAPIIQDIVMDFGVDDLDAINAMYELYCRVSDIDPFSNKEDENYQDGYREGYNDAIEEVESRLDDISWEIGRLKKRN